MKNVYKIYDELKELSAEELMQRIVAYPDQNKLNFDAPGKKKTYPLGQMAERINDPQKDKVFYAMAYSFAKILAQDEAVA